MGFARFALVGLFNCFVSVLVSAPVAIMTLNLMSPGGMVATYLAFVLVAGFFIQSLIKGFTRQLLVYLAYASVMAAVLRLKEWCGHNRDYSKQKGSWGNPSFGAASVRILVQNCKYVSKFLLSLSIGKAQYFWWQLFLIPTYCKKARLIEVKRVFIWKQRLKSKRRQLRCNQTRSNKMQVFNLLILER